MEIKWRLWIKTTETQDTKLIEKIAIVGYNINAYIFILKMEHTVFHFSDCRKNITLSHYLNSLKRVLERGLMLT